jgi:PAS domain S-box-containing protein
VSQQGDTTGEGAARPLAQSSRADGLPSYREVFDVTHDALFVHDETGRILDVNERMCSMFRCPRSVALTLSLHDVSLGESPYSEVEARGKIALAVARGSTTFEWRTKRCDSTLFWSEVSLHSATVCGERRVIASVRDITAQREAEDALRLSEERFRALASMAREGIMVHVDGVILDVNQAFVEIVGLGAPSELIGKNGLDAVPLTDESRERIREMRRSCETNPYDIELVRHDGKRVYAETASRATTYFGRPARLVFVRDITDRQRAEQALRQSEERFRHLFDAGADAIFVVDDEGKITDVNRAACETLGYSREELLRLIVLDIVASTTRERLARFFKEVLERGQVDVEGVQRRRDGTQFPVDTRVTAFRTAEGPRFFAAVRDITDRKRQEEARRQSERRLTMAISATADAIWEWNVATNETYYSPRWYEMLGYQDQDFPMNLEAWSRLCHPEDLSAMRERLTAANSDVRSTAVAIEFRMRARDGSWRWILGRGSVVERDSDGAPLLVCGTITDVTERKRNEAERARLEESLRHAQKLESMGRLAGGVAHDFNNFLTAIRGNVSLALHDVQPRDPLHELLIDVDKVAESAAKLTHQLLAFSRKQVILPKVVSLNDLILQLQKMLMRLLGEDIALETKLAADLASVRIDPGQLEQILVNLAVNARDAMPDGGRLTIETSNVHLVEAATTAEDGIPPGHYVRLSMSDEGTGMTDEVRAHLFEPFFTTKQDGRGTGLGLPMVYGAVRQNRGRIEVRSEVGRGTTITMHLPALAEVAERVSTRPRVELARGSETVVLVEDDASVRSVAVRLLQRQGYTVRAYANASEALVAIREASLSPSRDGRVHLLLTDVVMPGMNGRALAEKARSLLPDLKVLFTSGYPEDTVAHHGIIEQGIEFLPKPYTLSGLAQRVREVLEASPARDDG